jgi:hypothetical protein
MKTEREIREAIGLARNKMRRLQGDDPASYVAAHVIVDALVWVLGEVEEDNAVDALFRDYRIKWN